MNCHRIRSSSCTIRHTGRQYPMPHPANPIINQHPDLPKSLLFSPEFDAAIVGTETRANSEAPVLTYSEEKLVQAMYEQLLELEDEEDQLKEDVRAEVWEAARDSVFYRLDEGLSQMGKWAPVLVS